MGAAHRPRPVHRCGRAAARRGTARATRDRRRPGDRQSNAVVSTASYEAREYGGIGSGMPLKTAVRRVLSGAAAGGRALRAASQQVMDTLRALDGAVVEVSGVGTRRSSASTPPTTRRPSRGASRLPYSSHTDLHCSVGIGDTKIGQDHHRLRQAAGVFRVPPGRTGSEVWATAPPAHSGGSAPGSRPGWPVSESSPCATWPRRARAARGGVRADDGPALRPARTGRRQPLES